MSPDSKSPPPSFRPVSLSLSDLLGAAHTAAVVRARAALTGEAEAALAELARTPVEFLPAAFLARQHQLLARVGSRLVTPSEEPAWPGASSRTFTAASQLGLAPLSALGLYRIGEDGRLYLISKSEHYHAPLGHGFPGYELLDRARRLGLPNATHNNTRGVLTRRLETELVRAVNGLAADDEAGLADALAGRDPHVCNRVLNLETGSLAVEAALKMILARFHRIDPASPEPQYAGRVPVLLVMGNDDGGLQANYHGTTMFLQMARGLWPTLARGLQQAGGLQVCPVRPNDFDGLTAAFAQWERPGFKIAGFCHEIVMMNYGARLLSPEFLRYAHHLCRQHDVPTIVDEIQSCLWHHELFLLREWGLTPSFVAVGKGFPGGEYPASRLLFSAAFDTLPQFGALVTNGQEELAALAYLVTMRWARANADLTRSIGDDYERRLRELAAAHPAVLTAVAGKRHLSALHFRELPAATAFARLLNQRGLDLSAQTYKADCPPAVLTKLPLIATGSVVDFVVEQMAAALRDIAAAPGAPA